MASPAKENSIAPEARLSEAGAVPPESSSSGWLLAAVNSNASLRQMKFPFIDHAERVSGHDNFPLTLVSVSVRPVAAFS